MSELDWKIRNEQVPSLRFLSWEEDTKLQQGNNVIIKRIQSAYTPTFKKSVKPDNGQCFKRQQPAKILFLPARTESNKERRYNSMGIK